MICTCFAFESMEVRPGKAKKNVLIIYISTDEVQKEHKVRSIPQGKRSYTLTNKLMFGSNLLNCLNELRVSHTSATSVSHEVHISIIY